MAPRPLLLLAFVALLGALLSLTFADTGALPSEAVAGACGDWWCARRNTWPVGLAVGFGGIAAVATALAAVGSLPDDEPGETAPPERARIERPLWATRRGDHS